MTSSAEPARFAALAIPQAAPAPAVPAGPWAALHQPAAEPPTPPPPVDRRQQELEQAYADGYHRGRADGERDTALQLQPAIDALYAAAATLAESRAAFEASAAADIQALALAVARQLVQREVAADPLVIQGLVQKALDLLPQDRSITIRANAEDLEALQPALSEIVTQGRGTELRWVADPELGRGSFRLETPSRVVDGRIDTALRALYDQVIYE